MKSPDAIKTTRTPKVTAKDRHRQKLLEYLGNPENGFPTRTAMALEVLGFKQVKSFYEAFTIEEMAEMEREGLELRRQKYSSYLAGVDTAVLRKAAKGDAKSAKLAYQRFENWSERQAVDATVSGDLGVSFTVNFVGGSDGPEPAD